MRHRWTSRIFALLFFGLPSLAMAQSDDQFGSAIHGFNTLTFKNDYITPRGLLVTNKGFSIQTVNGLAINAYHNADGTLNDVSIVTGIFNDLNPANQNNPNVGFWNEFDWFTGVNFNFMKTWSAGVQYVAFISPPGNFTTEHNIEFNLGYDDSGKWAYPISFKPYTKLFFTAAGDSTVVLGQVPSFDVELGGIPTWETHLKQMPLTLTAPTWFTVGPSSFWGGSCNFGVFSTGINASTPLTFVPKRFGGWSFNIGVQYYNLVNSQLRDAQQDTGAVAPGSNGFRNVVVVAAGLGFHF